MNYKLLSDKRILLGILIFIFIFVYLTENYVENFGGTCEANYNEVYKSNLNTNIRNCCDLADIISIDGIFDNMKDSISNLPSGDEIVNLSIGQIIEINSKGAQITELNNKFSDNE